MLRLLIFTNLPDALLVLPNLIASIFNKA